MGLVFPREDIQRAYQNLLTGTKDSTAYALELLDNVLSRDLKDELFPIIEDMPASERLRRFRSLLSEWEDI